MEAKFESQGFGKRLKSMLKVDFRRMFTTPLLYIMLGVSFVIPILVLVMTTMMGEPADPVAVTSAVTPHPGVDATAPMEAFENVGRSSAR